MRKRIKLKYDQDDILEIVTEAMAKEYKFGEFNINAMVLGTPGVDLRIVAVVGELDDKSIYEVDLEAVDKEMDYNGFHSRIKASDMDAFAKKNLDDLKEI